MLRRRVAHLPVSDWRGSPGTPGLRFDFKFDPNEIVGQDDGIKPACG